MYSQKTNHMSEEVKKGFYTEPYTSNTVAVTETGVYRVNSINGVKIITNEKTQISSAMISKWKYNDVFN